MKNQLVNILCMAAICAMPASFTYACFSLSEGSTNPEFIQFIGIAPWLIVLLVGAIYATAKSVEKKN